MVADCHWLGGDDADAMRRAIHQLDLLKSGLHLSYARENGDYSAGAMTRFASPFFSTVALPKILKTQAIRFALHVFVASN